MPATDSELTSMEDPLTQEDEEGSVTNIPSSVSPPTVPSPTPLVPTTTRPNFTSETVIETKAVSMASNDCSSALSSPAEASPAKSAVTSPTTFNGHVERSPPTSHIASASDSLGCTGTSLIKLSESQPSLPVLPSTKFGNPDPGSDFPPALTFKGVSVTLENNSVWKQFNGCGTEMILTKQGRRMFPYCRYRLSGLDPDRQYSLVLSIVPSTQYKYRWSMTRWEVNGPSEHEAQGLIRAFSHHYSACRGSEWMGSLVSFYKLKLTNNPQDVEGHIILHSMHRYIPRLHVIPVPDGDLPTPDQPVVMGPESMTFTFPQTEFMAVTTYQNFRITQLKINHNPFAKGFREDGNNPRLNRGTAETQSVVKTDTQPPAAVKPAELTETKEEEEVIDLSTKNHTVAASPSSGQETRLVLKPIMSFSATKDEPYVPCLRGKHALGQLVLVQKRPLVNPKEETRCVDVTPAVQRGLKETPEATLATPTSPMSTPESSPGYRKRRKMKNRRWANSRGKECKAAAASPTVVRSPSLTVAMQPEVDDVEGLLFVSFNSKEALEVHIGPANSSSASPSASLVSQTTQMQLKPTVEVSPETDEEKIARLEAVLVQDLKVLKHRQAIHPVLQEVGMKLSSLDPTKSIDLQYLGVHLPLPPPNQPEHGDATAPGDEGLPFLSRTGKTSDMTKIKGWKNKFIRSKETSPNCDASQKNLSAFCSNMLDEYLESEAQYISERAAAFSTNPEGSVAYQLPAKSSSYVKTLDSVLKHRNAATKFPVGANRPCPLSHKPLLYSALTSPAPPLASAATPVQAAAESVQQSASSHSNTNSASPRSPTYHPGVGQRAAGSFGQSPGMAHRSQGLSKCQFRLLQMEIGAQNQGLSRTQLTPDRLSVALSVILTKQMQPSQVSKVRQLPKRKSEGPECGQDFCTLGCVCSSLQHLHRGPLHCRRPDCMFGCACFKRKITKQLMGGEREPLIQPIYSMTNMEHAVQPRPGSHANKLWNRSTHDVDPEPLFTPKSAPLCLAPVKVVKRCSVPRPTQPIREEDKDPVYRYLESLMTCARVREFNSKPPPVVMEPTILDTSTPNTTEKPQQTTTTDNLPKMYYRTVLSVKKTATSQGSASNEAGARKQIEIQSACPWDKDRKMVLETLCRRMTRDRLCQRFSAGPYRVRPVAKIFMRKPSGSIVTYRVHISKPSTASDDEEDDFDDSDEEKHADKSLDEDFDAEEEDGQIEEPGLRFGVTPFLSGVLPAGKLRARTKPVGCQASGLIQVNGKSYNQARLLLGNMGSLHPANRLAAYVTGRLHGPFDISEKNSQKSEPANNTSTPSALHVKAAGAAVPPTVTARKTSDLQIPAQPPVQECQPDSQRKGSITVPPHLQNPSTANPVQPFVSAQRGSVGAFQNSSTSSPVSLTVSQSLKTPSFLGQSGTYSFRICPPASQGAASQNPQGITLPGGFTLIQLPKPGADRAEQQSESVNSANTASMDRVRAHFGRLLADSDANWLGLNTAMDLSSRRSVEPRSFAELVCAEKMSSDQSDETNSRKVETNLDIASEDLSSDSSDFCGEGDEDDEVVDIETVEEVQHGLAIAKMKEAVRKALQESRESSDEFGSARELQDQTNDDSKDKRRRKNHTVLERQRRSEQRDLFDKLQTVLQGDPKAPRLRLLSLALKEIQNLVETSKVLEEKKRRLTRLQAVYVKQLSHLSGKSDEMIKQKVKEICDRQKMREKTMKWRPFFSQLLQSRAALLQATASQSKQQPAPLLQPDFCMPSQAYPHTTAPQSSVPQTPPPLPPPLPQTVLAPPPQAEIQPGKPVASVKTERQTEPSLPQAPSAAASLQVAAASSVSSTPKLIKKPSAPAPKPLALPLIRSKTGRIILPSSLKPLGQGFYTLMVVNPKQKGGGGEVSSSASIQPPPESDFKSDLESSQTVTSSTSEPKRPGGAAPLTELALLNKSIFAPPVARQAAENGQGGGTAAASNETLPSACLSFQRQAFISVELEADPSPPVVRRRRGRPRKQPVTPVGESEKHTVVEDPNKSVSESETSVLDEERQSEKMTLEATPAEEPRGVVSDDPVPVKRGRGRPPKNNSNLAQLSSPRVAQTRRSSSKSNEGSPVRLPRSFKSPDTGHKESPDVGGANTSRPLTRGALGKDFPSAKKRYWIDIEKELEPELDSE